MIKDLYWVFLREGYIFEIKLSDTYIRRINNFLKLSLLSFVMLQFLIINARFDANPYLEIMGQILMKPKQWTKEEIVSITRTFFLMG
jgi:hypothetical protein